ncbi:hypothetical protein ACFXTH_015443 [Malus domestica]
MPPAQNLKHRVFICLNKLSDRDTYSLAASELESIARTLDPASVPVFLSCIQSTDASDKSPVRRQCVQMITVLSETHGDSLSPHLTKMLNSITKRLRDPDSAVRSACQTAVASLSCHVTKPSSFGSFLKPLTDALFTEQDPNSQIGSALCLASGIDAAPDPEPSKLARLLPKLEKLVKCDGYKAKPAVLTLIGSVIGSGGASGHGALRSLVPCLVGFLSSEDWAARKAAAEALLKLAVVERDELSEFKSGSLRTFESRKFDKVKGVREVMNQMMEAWKHIPDLSDEASPPPQSIASSKENAGDGRQPVRSRNCEVPGSGARQLKKKPTPASRSTPPDSSYATTDRNRSTLKSNDKKVNPGMFRKPGHKKPSDWEAEISALSAPSSAGAFNDGFKETDENIPAERRINGNTKRALFHRSSDNKVHKFGGSRSGSRVAPYHEERAESPVVVSNVTENSHKNRRECEDLSLIRNQLLQIEKQQSSLLDLVQNFMGSSQTGMRSLETRVHGLELALDGISYDLALSSGRMTKVESRRSSCCLLPGADFWSSKFWRKTEGRYSTSRYPNSCGIAPAAAMRYTADDSGNAETSESLRFPLQDRSGFIVNPLAEIRSGSRGVSEMARR